MATRCHIAFYEQESEADLTKFAALIYRHWDGYPAAVLPEIIPILKEFQAERGLSDVEYASAYLVARLKTGFLNIGISAALHGDIEYLYAVYPSGRIDIYTTNFWRGDFTDVDKVETVNIQTWQPCTECAEEKWL